MSYICPNIINPYVQLCFCCNILLYINIIDSDFRYKYPTLYDIVNAICITYITASFGKLVGDLFQAIVKMFHGPGGSNPQGQGNSGQNSTGGGPPKNPKDIHSTKPGNRKNNRIKKDSDTFTESD